MTHTDTEEVGLHLPEKDGRKANALSRISKVIDKALEDSEVFREAVDKIELMNTCSTLMDGSTTLQEILSISEDALRRRIEGMMAGRVLGRLLDSLTPEEIEAFNTAVEGRLAVVSA